MSAYVISDPLLIPAQETQSMSMAILIAHTEVERAVCDCCGLTEACTPAYIERIREHYHGKWICELCSEAIKDEIVRTERLVGMEEATVRHAACELLHEVQVPGGAALGSHHSLDIRHEAAPEEDPGVAVDPKQSYEDGCRGGGTGIGAV